MITRWVQGDIFLTQAQAVTVGLSADGRLGVAVGEQRRTVEVPAAHLAKLRRFAELRAG